MKTNEIQATVLREACEIAKLARQNLVFGRNLPHPVQDQVNSADMVIAMQAQADALQTAVEQSGPKTPPPEPSPPPPPPAEPERSPQAIPAPVPQPERQPTPQRPSAGRPGRPPRWVWPAGAAAAGLLGGAAIATLLPIGSAETPPAEQENPPAVVLPVEPEPTPELPPEPRPEPAGGSLLQYLEDNGYHVPPGNGSKIQ